MESKKNNSQISFIPISTTRRPELELLDPLSPTSLKAAKPPSESDPEHVRVLKYLIYHYISMKERYVLG